MNATTYGLDVAKSVFQLYWVDAQTGEIVNRRFARGDLIKFLSCRLPGRVALEARGSGHWWARKIGTMGHEVVLLHAKFIRPFVQTNKTDAADARAIWTAVHQPGMRTVAVKSEEQQAMLSLHRMRTLLLKFRTMQVNHCEGCFTSSALHSGQVASPVSPRSGHAWPSSRASYQARCCPVCKSRLHVSLLLPSGYSCLQSIDVLLQSIE